MAHYYDEKPTVESKPQEIEFRINGIDFRFKTDRGVFSKTKLDFGSELLIGTAIKDLVSHTVKELAILDLGCGYGPVGIAMKRVFPRASLTMVDINERAILLAKENAQNNLVKYANIFLSDGCDEVKEQFDVVLTNPPIRAGKSVVFRFYEGAFEHLKPAGILYVVIQKKQGAPSSQTKLTELFGNCEVIEREGGYWILKSIKKNNK